MDTDSKIVYVAAAVLKHQDESIFLVQRPFNASMGGMWEFPGGKIEAGESPEDALVRELKEEIDIIVDKDDLKPLIFISHKYSTFHLVMLTYECSKWQREIKLCENQADYKWVLPSQLGQYLVPDADLPIIKILQNT